MMKTVKILKTQKKSLLQRIFSSAIECGTLYFVAVSAISMGVMFATQKTDSGICMDMSPSNHLLLILVLTVIPVVVIYLLRIILAYFSLYRHFTNTFYVFVFATAFCFINWPPPPRFIGDPPIPLAVEFVFFVIAIMIAENYVRSINK